jgi:hypothetical protein
MNTLTEAMTTGQGIERPFRCTEHDDHMASASVNVIKMVWCCFACGAHGNVDSKRVPKVDELRIMMEPEALPRIYDDVFLDLYSDPGYWLTRFPNWVCWAMGLGSDPFSGDATFPVHTAGGLLAGVGRRKLEPEDGPRYVYPRHWSAASSMFGMGGHYQPVRDVLVVVEGAADASSCWETGCPALAVYGSGLHRPQYELIARCAPKVVLTGFDMDEAGTKATTRALADLEGTYMVASVAWSGSDPAACTPGVRLFNLLEAVAASGYRGDVRPDWEENTNQMQHEYQRQLEDK